MKYTLYGYRQDIACELGLYFDELAILRYIDDFRNTGNMYFEEIEGKKYYWVLYESVVEFYPTFKTRFKDPTRKVADMMRKGNLNKVLDFKLLHWNGRKRGTYTFFAINEEIYQELIAPIIDKKEVKKEVAPTKEEPQQEPYKEEQAYKEEQPQEIYKPSPLNAEEIEEYVNNFSDKVKPYVRKYLEGKTENIANLTLKILSKKSEQEQIRILIKKMKG